MGNFAIAFIVLLGFLFVSRIINEKANKKLDQSKKASLVDLFSGTRIYNFLILIAIISIFFLCAHYNLIKPILLYTSYSILLLVFIVISSYLVYKKLKKNDFPITYIRSYILATSIRFLGLIIFFALTIEIRI